VDAREAACRGAQRAAGAHLRVPKVDPAQRSVLPACEGRAAARPDAAVRKLRAHVAVDL